MAKAAFLGQRFFIHGYDLSGDVGAISNAAAPRTEQVATGLDKTAIERLLTRADGSLEWVVFFNDAAGQEHVGLKGLVATDRIVIWGLSINLSDPVACLVAKQVNYDWAKNADGSMEGRVQALANGTPLEWCKNLTAGKITHASATSSTGEVDAQTTQGLVAYLVIFSLGSGTPTILVEHSADTTNGIDGTWSTKITFASQAALLGERITATGTVEKGLRVTTTGTFTNLVFAVAFRRGTAQDDVSLA